MCGKRPFLYLGYACGVGVGHAPGWQLGGVGDGSWGGVAVTVGGRGVWVPQRTGSHGGVAVLCGVGVWVAQLAPGTQVGVIGGVGVAQWLGLQGGVGDGSWGGVAVTVGGRGVWVPQRTGSHGGVTVLCGVGVWGSQLAPGTQVGVIGGVGVVQWLGLQGGVGDGSWGGVAVTVGGRGVWVPQRTGSHGGVVVLCGVGVWGSQLAPGTQVGVIGGVGVVQWLGLHGGVGDGSLGGVDEGSPGGVTRGVLVGCTVGVICGWLVGVWVGG